MMRAACVCLTFGRREVCELVSMIARQTVRPQLVIWIDDVPELGTSELPSWITPIYGPALGPRESIGEVRRRACEAAVVCCQLALSDALLILDDDDYYAPHHVAQTLSALEVAPFVTAGRFGLEQYAGQREPYLFRMGSDGFGAHASWGINVGAYFDAGGYREVDYEDVDLARRLGTPAQVHGRVTHVRRTNRSQISQTPMYNRTSARAAADCVRAIVPTWNEHLDELERWCAAQG